ncbi:methyltransferase [Colletotrichum musicola]|uniref:Methyltransferase n=1 Tax=Colletotrichum musicola TaxID=2175873 RepID=A0A8H6JEJ1_9PEZI|nr:methyltransferase [Colletotrichum musicola]
MVDYPVEHGRRYHAFRPGAYFAPNDEKAIDHLDLAHMLMLRAMGERLYLAPLEPGKVHRILDIGTGTGLWATEMAERFPNALVTGNDLSAIQPDWLPPNVRFEIDDVESPWVGHQKYDFIFCRYMAGSIQDWPRLVETIYEHLNPGGWAEFQDMICEYYSDDGSYTPDHATWRWNKTLVRALEGLGRDPNPAPKLEGWVRGAGFRRVHHHKVKTPIGPWPRDPAYKDLGLLNLVQNVAGLEGFSMRLLCGVLGKSEEEALAQVAQVEGELKGAAFHALFDIHVVYGQKASEQAAW